jgi:hypothetical protein
MLLFCGLYHILSRFFTERVISECLYQLRFFIVAYYLVLKCQNNIWKKTFDIYNKYDTRCVFFRRFCDWLQKQIDF